MNMRDFLITTVYAAFLLLIAAIALIFYGLTTPAMACEYTNDGHVICPQTQGSPGGFMALFRSGESGPTVRRSGRRAARHIDANGNAVIIGGRPAGCPHRYCGCGLRKYLGIADKRLNLAWNWARLFPRVAGPAPGVAAVRRGHVMYIERAAGNGRWLIRDYNSGGGLSRLHVRSVRGYVFVNPHTTMVSARRHR